MPLCCFGSAEKQSEQSPSRPTKQASPTNNKSHPNHERDSRVCAGTTTSKSSGGAPFISLSASEHRFPSNRTQSDVNFPCVPKTPTGTDLAAEVSTCSTDCVPVRACSQGAARCGVPHQPHAHGSQSSSAAAASELKSASHCRADADSPPIDSQAPQSVDCSHAAGAISAHAAASHIILGQRGCPEAPSPRSTVAQSPNRCLPPMQPASPNKTEPSHSVQPCPPAPTINEHEPVTTPAAMPPARPIRLRSTMSLQLPQVNANIPQYLSVKTSSFAEESNSSIGVLQNTTIIDLVKSQPVFGAPSRGQHSRLKTAAAVCVLPTIAGSASSVRTADTVSNCGGHQSNNLASTSSDNVQNLQNGCI